MSTSNSVNFTMSRDDIITDAMQTINALGIDETPSAADIDMCSRKLNMMVKALMAQGIRLWAMKEATLFLGVGTQTYSLGATGTHCTNTYAHTTLSAAAALSATSLSLTSTTGMSASDNIGIVLDSGSIHWTTISGAPGAPTTIASGLAGAAASGNVVFAYTTKINRPQRIRSAYRRDINNIDTPIALISREEYADLANKLVRGKTIQAFYDPQLTNGILSAWPTPDLATDVIRFWYERILEDFDASTDNPDFPIEWGEYLSAGLSYRISKPFGLSKSERDSLREDAAMLLDTAMGFDRETASVMFQPDLR